MAKLNEQKVTIQLSELLRDTEEAKDILTDEQLADIVEAIQTLAGEKILVELE